MKLEDVRNSLLLKCLAVFLALGIIAMIFDTVRHMKPRDVPVEASVPNKEK